MVERPEEPAPFNWERLLQGVFVIGLTLWVLGGAVSSILLAYFAEPVSAPAASAPSQTAVEAYRAFHTLESIVFKVWIAAGLTLVLPSFRTGSRSRKSGLSDSDLPLPR